MHAIGTLPLFETLLQPRRVAYTRPPGIDRWAEIPSMPNRVPPLPPRDPSPLGPLGEESSLELLRLAQNGDEAALDRLCERLLPRLRRWATGRLPLAARDLGDTEDVVQSAMVSALAHLPDFEPRHDGALQGYLRQAVLNQIRDHARRARRRPEMTAVSGDEPDRDASPLEQAIGGETIARYEAALARLRPQEREAIHLRLELECDYAEIATALGKPSANTARMTVSRALVRLAEAMGRDL
jgi:RNA polymerase sigma-70 factor (ECF subfamily)